MNDAPTPDDTRVIAQTRCWLEQAVIGLQLCPFAKAPHVKGLVRYAVSGARTADNLLTDLAHELEHLHRSPANEVETTLLIHPQVLSDFLEYNQFLEASERLIRQLELEGEIQIAGFHPQFQFAQTLTDDLGNATNRSPWPTLHLLREASIERAIQAHPQTQFIYETNIATMERLGPQGWARLQQQILAATH
jgi:hypothetical protein